MTSTAHHNHGRQYTDSEARHLALRWLSTHLSHDAATRVIWDGVHLLQGHFEVAGTWYVLIAARRCCHTPQLFTEQHWDAFHREHAVAA